MEGGLFVDVKQAWESFARTGKVEDYIHYTRLKTSWKTTLEERCGVQVVTQGLIIKEQAVGESDRLVTILTKDEAWCAPLPAAPRI